MNKSTLSNYQSYKQINPMTAGFKIKAVANPEKDIKNRMERLKVKKEFTDVCYNIKKEKFDEYTDKIAEQYSKAMTEDEYMYVELDEIAEKIAEDVKSMETDASTLESYEYYSVESFVHRIERKVWEIYRKRT